MCREVPSDSALIQAYLQGNSGALTQLWLRYDSLVYGIAHSLLCQHCAAEDIRQEVFLKVMMQLCQLQEPDKFKSWLRSLTYNASYSWLRSQRNMTPLESLHQGQHPQILSAEAEVEQRERRTLLRQMIDRLSEEHRVVIELHYFEGLRIADIAEFLELPESTIKWRIHKACEILTCWGASSWMPTTAIWLPRKGCVTNLSSRQCLKSSMSWGNDLARKP